MYIIIIMWFHTAFWIITLWIIFLFSVFHYFIYYVLLKLRHKVSIKNNSSLIASNSPNYSRTLRERFLAVAEKHSGKSSRLSKVTGEDSPVVNKLPKEIFLLTFDSSTAFFSVINICVNIWCKSKLYDSLIILTKRSKKYLQRFR